MAQSNGMEILKLKVALLTQGVQLPSKEDSGRQGGAGPTFGRYFLIADEVLVNAPVRRGQLAKRFQALHLEPLPNGNFRIRDFPTIFPEIQPIPAPQFYAQQLPDGTPMSHIALVHGINCLGSTIVQHCDYFNQGLECQFCTISRSLALGTTILRKTPEQFLAVLQAAESEGRANHLTLTIGSPNRDDRGVNDYIDFVKELRQHSEIPVHVQIEPPTPLSILQQLRDVGVDTVGIHIEIFDDKLRQRFCPGKFAYATFADYLDAWRLAVQLFGRGQVSTFILLGLGESLDGLHQGFESTIQTGVIPVPVPCRPNPGSKLEGFIPDYVQNLERTIGIYLDCAQLLVQHDLDPSVHRAGCVRCTGCTAITEAYHVVATKNL